MGSSRDDLSCLCHSGLEMKLVILKDGLSQRTDCIRPHCPQDLASRAKRLVGVTKVKVAFLDQNNQLCTWDLSDGADGIQKHFFLPRDWLDSNSLDMAILHDEGPFFCPKGRHVAIVRNALRDMELMEAKQQILTFPIILDVE